MHKARHIAAAVVLGSALAVAAPLAANASIINSTVVSAAYPPATQPPVPTFVATPSVTGNGTYVAPVTFDGGTFLPGVSVTADVNGIGPAPIQAVFLAADLGTFRLGTSSGSGSLSGSLTFPASAADHTYTLTFPAAETASGQTFSTSVVVQNVAGTSQSTASTSKSGLATTGTYVSLVTVWAAVGLIALGAAALGSRAIARRSRAKRA